MISNKEKVIVAWIGVACCCIVGILCLMVGQWFLSIPFIVGEGIFIWILDRLDRKAHPLASRYRKVLWGNNSERLFMQWLPGYIPPLIFVTVYLLSTPLLASYVLSIVVGALVSLAFSHLFLQSLKNSTIPEIDELHIPFEFKRKRLMETPEDMPILNAWTLGTISPGLVVTNALFQYLNREELRAVLLHEVGHVKGKHLLILSIYGVFYTPSILLLVFAGYTLYGLVASIILTILLIWLRHLLELKADAFTVRENGEGESLVSALQKIDNINNETASRALGIKKQNFSLSHPSLNRRIKRIREISGGL